MPKRLPQKNMAAIDDRRSAHFRKKRVFEIILLYVFVLFCIPLGCGRGKTLFKPRYPSEKAYAGFLGSMLWKLRGKSEKALQDALRAVREDPGSAYLKVSAARFLLHMERYEDAGKMLNQAKKIRPDLPDIYLVSAMVDMISGEMRSAKKALQTATKKAPGWKDVYWAKARYHQMTGCWKSEINEYKHLVKMNADDAAALMALGSLKRRKGDHRKAEGYLEKLIRRFPWYGRAYLESAYLAYARGDQRGAEKYLKIALEMDDDDISTAETLWRFYILHGKRKEAFDLLKKMKAHGSPAYWAFIAERYMEQGLFKKAKEILGRAREMASGSREVFLVEIEMMILNGEFEEAEKRAIEAFGNERIQSAAIGALVNVYLRWGECERGVKKLRSLEVEETLESLTSLAYIEAQCGKKGVLRRRFENKVSSKGLDEEALYRAAVVLEAADEHEEALKTANKILSVSPRNYHALNFIGYVYAKHGINLTAGLGLLRQAISLMPFDPIVMDSLAWIHFKSGETDRSEDYGRKALMIMPNEPEFLYHVGRIEEKKGMVKSARERYETALRFYPFPRIKKAVEKRLEVLVKK